MPVWSKSNLVLGFGVIAFAAVLLWLWIPFDTQTGLIEKVRRQVVIGDALAPSVAGLFLLVGGGLLVTVERRAEGQPSPDPVGLAAAAALVAVVAAGLLVMRHAGPAAVWLSNTLTGGELEYRLLRDERPWKYIGFLLGGTIAIAGMVMVIERRASLRAMLIAVVAVLAMIAIYDLPFDDLLLPPNGDV